LDDISEAPIDRIEELDVADGLNVREIGERNRIVDDAKSWSRLSEQIPRVDKWSVCRV
jgi:hypothetical protein